MGTLEDHITAQLVPLLPDFIASRRWFRAKTQTIQTVEVEDMLRVSHDSCILVIRVVYAGGKSDEYVLPILPGSGHPEETLIAAYQAENGLERRVYDALAHEDFRDSLIDAIACNSRFPGRNGELIASRTSAFPEACGAVDLKGKSFLSRAEQSNTSIIYGDRFILKLFRKIEPGINPDVEIGTFLTERGFRHTPAVLGNIEYLRRDGNVYAMAILQQFVRNQGDAWKYTLESLSGFFDRAAAGGRLAPALTSHHPMELMSHQMTSDIQELLGSYIDSARLLGLRTAEMHNVLADPHGGPDFKPEPFSPADGQKLYEEMLQTSNALELLRRKEATLTGPAAEDARTLLQMEHRAAELFARLRDYPVRAARIRFHGDFHLGQVLYTGSDFMIIDFEGEPARPLSERRSKALALRDVAGMIRSFQYAAYSALFSRGPTKSMESWADFWTAWVSAAYLNSYFNASEGSLFIAAKNQERRLLLDSFLLQKALYEVAYELNNRPDWVRIPLRGILSLVN